MECAEPCGTIASRPEISEHSLDSEKVLTSGRGRRGTLADRHQGASVSNDAKIPGRLVRESTNRRSLAKESCFELIGG